MIASKLFRIRLLLSSPLFFSPGKKTNCRPSVARSEQIGRRNLGIETVELQKKEGEEKGKKGRETDRARLKEHCASWLQVSFLLSFFLSGVHLFYALKIG